MATAPNLFTTAKVLETKATAGKKPVKTKTLLEGLELYAAIDHSIKWLTTALATAKTAVGEAALEKFVADGIAAKAKPENFDAEEGKATGNIQLKKRASTSGLNDIERDLCDTHKVPTVEVSDRAETFIFNPDHAKWLEVNAAKVSAALLKLGAPTDIIQMQTATTKTVTTDDSLAYVFRTFFKKPEVIAQLLPVVGTLAIKPKYAASEVDIINDDKALEVIKGFIGS
jgi:hypothetical protein